MVTRYSILSRVLLRVFNRWGGLVWEAMEEKVLAAKDGICTSRRKRTVIGTYYYIIDLNTGDEPQTGPITIIR